MRAGAWGDGGAESATDLVIPKRGPDTIHTIPYHTIPNHSIPYGVVVVAAPHGGGEVQVSKTGSTKTARVR